MSYGVWSSLQMGNVLYTPCLYKPQAAIIWTAASVNFPWKFLKGTSTIFQVTYRINLHMSHFVNT